MIKRFLKKKRLGYFREQANILEKAVKEPKETFRYAKLMLAFNLLQLKIELITVALGRDDAYNKAGRKSE